MRRLRFSLAAIGSLAICSTCCLAENGIGDGTVQMSREEWKSQVASSRQRAEEARRQRRSLRDHPPRKRRPSEHSKTIAFDRTTSFRPIAAFFDIRVFLTRHANQTIFSESVRILGRLV
jgi:hypothetical protein